MRKLISYLACSLNGKIARSNGSVDWLNELAKLGSVDYGYREFYNSIDTTIMGSNTYRHILEMGVEFPYKDKTNYIFTKESSFEKKDYIEFVSKSHVDKLNELKRSEGKNIWLVGGGKMNTLFHNEGLLDELWIYQMPIIIPDGIDIFEYQPSERIVKLLKLRSFETGAVEMIYDLQTR